MVFEMRSAASCTSATPLGWQQVIPAASRGMRPRHLLLQGQPLSKCSWPSTVYQPSVSQADKHPLTFLFTLDYCIPLGSDKQMRAVWTCRTCAGEAGIMTRLQ